MKARWIAWLLAWTAGSLAAADPYDLEPREIAPNTWMVEGATENFTPLNGGNIVNTAFVVTNAGVVVIDTGPSLRYGEALREAIRQVTDQPVTHVLLTHHHPDHVFGNQAFPQEALHALPETIEKLAAAGAAFAENMYRLVGDWMRGTEVVLPTRELAPGALVVGDHRFELYAFGGHTGADLVVLDRTTGTLFAGDMVFFNRALTTPQTPGLDVWREELSAIAALPFDRMVPGHGPLITDDRALSQMRAYMDWLDELFEASAAAGRSSNEVMNTPIPAQFEVVDEAAYELIRSTSHLYPAYERSALQPLTADGQP